MSKKNPSQKDFPLIVALDLDNFKQVQSLVLKLGLEITWYKVGLKLFTREGHKILEFLKKQKKKVFLDLKYHDIPNTVVAACREATRLKVDMLTLHTLGGSEMLSSAKKAVLEESRKLKCQPPKLLGVTVLTSHEDLSEIGIARKPQAQVKKLAMLAKNSKMDGIVCSAQELKSLQKILPRDFLRVTPGIRPLGADKGDQKRVMTPEAAWDLGADYLVMGRPILESKKPNDLIKKIKEKYIVI